jgi:drug/metabolite transporter (DMT)-like permease
VVRQRLCAQYTDVLLSYHAEAEADRGLAIAAVVVVAAVALFSVWLITIAPRRPDRRRGATAVALALLGVGVAALAATWAIPPEYDEEPPAVWGLLWVAIASAFLIAPVVAFVGFFREEGRLAGAAIGLSLVPIAVFVAGFVACGITRSCFH